MVLRMPSGESAPSKDAEMEIIFKPQRLTAIVGFPVPGSCWLWLCSKAGFKAPWPSMASSAPLVLVNPEVHRARLEAGMALPAQRRSSGGAKFSEAFLLQLSHTSVSLKGPSFLLRTGNQ